MKIRYVGAYFFAFIPCLLSIYIYLEFIYLAGFPDGSLTDLDRGEQILFKLFIIANVIWSLYLFFLIRSISRKKSDRTFYVSALVYIAFTVCIFFIDHYLSLHLMDGRGG